MPMTMAYSDLPLGMKLVEAFKWREAYRNAGIGIRARMDWLRDEGDAYDWVLDLLTGDAE